MDRPQLSVLCVGLGPGGAGRPSPTSSSGGTREVHRLLQQETARDGLDPPVNQRLMGMMICKRIACMTLAFRKLIHVSP
jgi:hypothetical protein